MTASATPAFAMREEITPRDRNLIFTLLNNSGFFHPREMAYGMDLFDEHLLKGEASSYQFMLHEKNGMLLGYGCYGPIKLSDRRYHLHWLAVDRNCQKQGIGHLLEAAITDKIRAIGGLKIYAEISNRDEHAPVRVFYEKCGYRLAAAIADFYADGDDKVLYVKDL
jgi:ribosomal protein S18 acetylase RimI-like enzyme